MCYAGVYKCINIYLYKIFVGPLARPRPGQIPSRPVDFGSLYIRDIAGK